MKENEFVFWLRGFFELSGATTLDEQQVKIINDHIDLVLTKITPTSYQSPLTIPPFDVERTIKNMGRDAYIGEQLRLYPCVICGSCGKTCSEEGGTCPLCKVYCKNLEAKDLPIINLPTHLSC